MSVHAFEVELSDTRRDRYESLSFTVARHPSETPLFLATRALAFCLEYEEGIAFSRGGLSDPDEPALSVSDLTGQRVAWIEVGLPAPDRLHRAAKACDRVSVWPHRDPRGWLQLLREHRIHHAESIEIHRVQPELLEWLAAGLDRRTRWSVTAAGDELYVQCGDRSRDGTLGEERLQAPGS